MNHSWVWAISVAAVCAVALFRHAEKVMESVEQTAYHSASDVENEQDE